MRPDFFSDPVPSCAAILFILAISAVIPHVVMALMSEPEEETVPAMWVPAPLPPPSSEAGINFDFTHGIRAGWNPEMLASMRGR